jgi:hypothetical protein
MQLTVKIIFYNLLFAIFFIPFFSPYFIPKEKITEDSQKILDINFEKLISENNLENSQESDFLEEEKEELEDNIIAETLISNDSDDEHFEESSGCVLSETTGGVLTCGGGDNPLSNLLPIIFIIIIIPLFFAFIIQKLYIRFLGKEDFEKNKKYFGEFSNLGLIIILFIIMSFDTNYIIFEKPELFLKSLFPVALFYLLTFSISFLIMKKFYKNNKKEGLAFF